MDWCMVVLSVVFFWVSSRVCRSLTPKSIPQKSAWKYANTANSLFHATIVGLGVLLCLLVRPELLDDLIEVYFRPSYLLLCVSLGYFLLDFSDMAFNDTGRKNLELLAHHTAVISAFSICLFSGRYMGHATVSMVVEANSIFLHIRQILNFHRTPKSNLIFRIVSFLTVVTFLVFRIMPVCWLLRTLVHQRHQYTGPIFAVGVFSYSLISIMNFVLFYRVVSSDYLLRSKHNMDSIKSAVPNGVIRTTAAAIASKTQ